MPEVKCSRPEIRPIFTYKIKYLDQFLKRCLNIPSKIILHYYESMLFYGAETWTRQVDENRHNR